MHCFYRYIAGRSLFAVRNLIGAQLSHERFALSDRGSEHREWLVLSDTGHNAKVSANLKEVKGLMQLGLASVTPNDANGTEMVRHMSIPSDNSEWLMLDPAFTGTELCLAHAPCMHGTNSLHQQGQAAGNYAVT